MQLLVVRRGERDKGATERKGGGCQEATCGSEALSIQPANELLNCGDLCQIVKGLLATKALTEYGIGAG